MKNRHIDDATILRIGDLYRSGKGARLIAEEMSLAEGTIEKIVAGKTKNARRVLGGSLTGGRKRPATQLVRAWTVPKRRGRPITSCNRKIEHMPRERRSTIFTWAREWEAAFDERVEA